MSQPGGGFRLFDLAVGRPGSVRRRSCSEAPLLPSAGVHGLLNFVGEPLEMLMQSAEHFTFGLICSLVAD
jgi:hypothetical protein